MFWAASVTLCLVHFGIYTVMLHHKIERIELTPGPAGPTGLMGERGLPGEPCVCAVSQIQVGPSAEDH